MNGKKITVTLVRLTVSFEPVNKRRYYLIKICKLSKNSR